MLSQHTRYYKVNSFAAGNLVELADFADFCSFTERNQLKDVFVSTAAENNASLFAVLYNQAVICKSTEGFETLEDYKEACKRNFVAAEDYYAAKKTGCTNYTEYKMVKEAGISDTALFEKIKQAGYITGFANYLKLKEDNKLPAEMPCLANAAELYNYASAQGFTVYENLAEALQKGFTDANTFQAALQRGYPDAAEYFFAAERGIQHYNDLLFIRERNIRDNQDFYKYLEMEFFENKDLRCDERVLLKLLSKLEQGKKISFTKLYTLFKNMLDEYRYADTGQLPPWFSTALDTEEQVATFLSKSTDVKKYGLYDNDGEFFEINNMKDRKVVIDGSNVAHNSSVAGNGKPKVSNILLMTDFLRSKGFEEIIVINDAALKHRLADADKLDELKDKTVYMEAPKENPADSFIIQFVKQHHCLLVSNDAFRDWKIRDPWVADNIDFYRLGFLINNQEVLLPDLK